MYEVFEKLLNLHNLTTYKVSKDTGISQTTFSNWKNGKITPKQDKMLILADYFNVSIDYMMGNDNSESQYYLNNETAKLAQEIFDRKDLKILFDASRNLNPEDIQFVIDMVERLKKDND